MTQAFIVEEWVALKSTYLYNGVWEIITRRQLDDGRWLIECKKWE
jgi:hypothetical protein